MHRTDRNGTYRGASPVISRVPQRSMIVVRASLSSNPRERRTDAVVDATPERQERLTPVPAAFAHRCRHVRKQRKHAVRGWPTTPTIPRCGRARGIRAPRSRRRRHGDFAHGRFEAQQLLDGFRRDTAFAQYRQHVGVCREVGELHRGHRPRRVEGSEQQVDDHRHELVAAQPVAAILRGDQIAEQVVTGITGPTAGFDEVRDQPERLAIASSAVQRVSSVMLALNISPRSLIHVSKSP